MATMETEFARTRAAMGRVAQMERVADALQKDHADLAGRLRTITASRLASTPPVSFAAAMRLLRVQPGDVRALVKRAYLVETSRGETSAVTAASLNDRLCNLRIRDVLTLRPDQRPEQDLDLSVAARGCLQDEDVLADQVLTEGLRRMLAEGAVPPAVPKRYRPPLTR